MRSALTVLGCVVGVAGLVAIVSTGQNIVRAQTTAYVAGSRADLTIFSWNVDRGVARALEALPNVAHAELRSTFATKWQIGRDWQDVYIIGLNDFNTIDVNRVQRAAGAFPVGDELMPEAAIRQFTRVDLGQPLLIRDRDGRTHAVTISGFAYSPAAISPALTQTPIVYAPAERVRRWTDTVGDNAIIIRFENFALKDETVAAVERLKETHPRSIRFVCLVSCPEGIATFRQAHPDVPIYTAAIDRELNDHAYILPGLGDAGDRIFGTK